MNWIIIPARQGSKGLPLKNRKLFSYTANMIPSSLVSRVIVTTDDMTICHVALTKGFHIHIRRAELCTDTAHTKSVLLDVINHYNIPDTDKITMLYLTYPTRTWKQIIAAHKFFDRVKGKSLLCREEQTNDEIHPYRWFFDSMKDCTGRQIIKHDLYRRQDYPRMFKASHAIFIAYAGEIKKLNKNLWNKKTVFYPIGEMVDVDTIKDFEHLEEQKK
jgi:CMP-N-acetylneuraminic acid synthetase